MAEIVRRSAPARAAYLITNDAENAIVALPINSDGTLSKGIVTATGGKGSNVLIPGGTAKQAPDALVAQASLVLVGNNIFAVNPGSNSLSMLEISAHDSLKLTIVGKPAALPGDFPNTVAVSEKHKLACVGLTGAKAGISCAPYSSKGLGPMDDLRPFDLNQTTPPVGKFNTVSQTFFNADETKLFTTVKGGQNATQPGFFSVFRVDGGGKLGRNDVRSSPDGTQILFGSTLIPGSPNKVFATDRSFGAVILSIDPQTDIATTIAKGVIPGQLATCWSIVSPATHSAFTTDGSLDRVVEMSLTDASVISDTELRNNDPGLLEVAAAGDFLYTLSAGNTTHQAAVTVLDVSGGQGSTKQIQHIQLGDMGVDENCEGMVLLK
ncbi:hypothetical protein NA57DRAFT_64801 [Rhizodiscina lignyota]|uniref:Uncharacterized protein n=1 Tax=Rhizodiscina lignyota TaxID=1504668 RepID=A0A9P4IN42_9PEZI|nr:hypothetical protein NA57DRAFT_64801 [Rhizodiscina lignyota]